VIWIYRSGNVELFYYWHHITSQRFGLKRFVESLTASIKFSLLQNQPISTFTWIFHQLNIHVSNQNHSSYYYYLILMHIADRCAITPLKYHLLLLVFSTQPGDLTFGCYHPQMEAVLVGVQGSMDSPIYSQIDPILIIYIVCFTMKVWSRNAWGF